MATVVHHSIAKKAERHGIRIVAVAPGLFSATDTKNKNQAEGEKPGELLDALLAAREPEVVEIEIPVGTQLAEPEEEPALPEIYTEELKSTKKARKSKPKKAAAPKPKKTKAPKAKKPTKKARRERDEEDEEDDGGERGASIVKSKYRVAYAESNIRDSNDDEFASALAKFLTVEEELDLKRLAQVAKDNGIDYGKYESHNPGHRRMIVGNILRGKHRKGGDVRIGNATIRGKKKVAPK